MKTVLRAGAGQEKIHFSKDLFPIISNPVEKYVGVHDELTARVLIVENEIRICIVMVETVIFFENSMNRIRECVAQISQIPKENVWFCVTHSLATPHFGIPFPRKTKEMYEKDEQIYKSYEKAVISATENAVSTMSTARVQTVTAHCHVNCNRNIQTREGWWIGSEDSLEADDEVSIMRFTDVETGKIKAVFYNYNCQPSVMGDSNTAGDGRLISADLAGAASAYINQQLGNEVVAIYSIGAGGDQGPRYKTYMDLIGKEGRIFHQDLRERGFTLVNVQGSMLGQQVVMAINSISDKMGECCDVKSSGFKVALKGQMTPPMHELHPVKKFAFQPGKEIETEVNLLQIGNTVLVGVQPEICMETERFIKESFPDLNVVLMTFVNGGAKYMAEKDKYEKIMFQAMNSPFEKGECEKFREKVVTEIKNLVVRHKGD